ncbi:hypothetical protein [Sphingomonas phyllosphaerae]|uniref:hypothetical protein n=1 Tax=Sphingomonas phyllosphaerae TaxID=257003 RepID=UPI0003B42EBD|nr:hypothetical protein [Sphingomonas phyllosphaerae]
MTDALPLTPDLLATWTNQELITEWSRTTWDEGEPQLGALAAEMERRGLDS